MWSPFRSAACKAKFTRNLPTAACLRPNSITLSWLQTGPRLVADLIAHATWLLVIGQIPARCRSATSLGPVCDQDSVMEFGFCHRLEQIICLNPGNVNTELLQKARCYCAWIFNSCCMDVSYFSNVLLTSTLWAIKKEPTSPFFITLSKINRFECSFGSRRSDHYFRNVCWFVCLSVCAQFFSAVFDPISIKLGHMLYVWV